MLARAAARPRGQSLRRGSGAVRSSALRAVRCARIQADRRGDLRRGVRREPGPACGDGALPGSGLARLQALTRTADLRAAGHRGALLVPDSAEVFSCGMPGLPSRGGALPPAPARGPFVRGCETDERPSLCSDSALRSASDLGGGGHRGRERRQSDAPLERSEGTQWCLERSRGVLPRSVGRRRF